MAKTATRKPPRHRPATPKSARRKPTRRSSGRRWSARVTRESDALDLKPGIFAENDPARIARSLKRSAEESKRRKAGAYQSAMSMLNFYINRAGGKLPGERRRVLTRAKAVLRRLFGRT